MISLPLTSTAQPQVGLVEVLLSSQVLIALSPPVWMICSKEHIRDRSMVSSARPLIRARRAAQSYLLIGLGVEGLGIGQGVGCIDGGLGHLDVDCLSQVSAGAAGVCRIIAAAGAGAGCAAGAEQAPVRLRQFVGYWLLQGIMAIVPHVQGIRCRSREEALLSLSAGWALCSCLFLTSCVPAAAVFLSMLQLQVSCTLCSRQRGSCGQPGADDLTC